MQNNRRSYRSDKLVQRLESGNGRTSMGRCECSLSDSKEKRCQEAETYINIGLLWVQEIEKMKTAKFDKISGVENPADLMTKGVCHEKMQRYMRSLSQSSRGGRARAGLQCSVGT